VFAGVFFHHLVTLDAGIFPQDHGDGDACGYEWLIIFNSLKQAQVAPHSLSFLSHNPLLLKTLDHYNCRIN
jgi:hypothetical protein